jgi:PAS domain S-box-containing protein
MKNAPHISISLLLILLIIISTFIIHANDYQNHLFFFLIYVSCIFLIFQLKRNTKINNFSDTDENSILPKGITNSLEVVWIWNHSKKKFSWSENVLTQLGYATTEVEDDLKWLFDKIHPQHHMRFSLEVFGLINEKNDQTNYTDIIQVKNKFNEYKYYQSIIEVHKKSEDDLQLIGSLVDVSKFKTEEIRLQLLESVVLNSKESILILEGIQEHGKFPKVLYTNDSFVKNTGYNLSEIQSSGLEVLFLNDAIPSFGYQNCIEKLLFHQDFVTELQAVKKDRTILWLQLSLVPIFDSNEEITHFISIIRDITLEKEREKEREKLIGDLQKSLEDLQQFSYITSHNFRAPLSNLLALNNLIQDYQIEDESLKELIHGYQKSTSLLNETIEDLIKTIVIRDTEVDCEWLAVEDLVNDCKQLLEHQFKNKVSIELNLQQKEIWFHKAYAENIFLNLINNAIKYRNPENEICQISISCENTPKGTLLQISDNGIGINLNLNHEKVFGLYQRFHSNTEGKGIGLYLVKNQMKSLGGEISVESEVNKGTTFKLIFKNPI